MQRDSPLHRPPICGCSLTLLEGAKGIKGCRVLAEGGSASLGTRAAVCRPGQATACAACRRRAVRCCRGSRRLQQVCQCGRAGGAGGGRGAGSSWAVPAAGAAVLVWHCGRAGGAAAGWRRRKRHRSWHGLGGGRRGQLDAPQGLLDGGADVHILQLLGPSLAGRQLSQRRLAGLQAACVAGRAGRFFSCGTVLVSVTMP